MSLTSSSAVQCLVATGYGINCEKEMALAAELAGAKARIVHLQKLLQQPALLESTDLLLFPGGFSFGDELGAAKVYANKIAFTEVNGRSLRRVLQDFVDGGGAIFGVCNGFQLLIKLGLLPHYTEDGPSASLAHNSSMRFEDRWCWHRVSPSPCIFTQGLEKLWLPVRHGEGRFVCSAAERQRLLEQRQIVLQYSDEQGHVTETYPANPNGSLLGIAGVCDPTGRIFGMMAHPEAFVQPYQHPAWTRGSFDEEPHGALLFRSGIDALKKSKQNLVSNPG